MVHPERHGCQSPEILRDCTLRTTDNELARCGRACFAFALRIDLFGDLPADPYTLRCACSIHPAEPVTVKVWLTKMWWGQLCPSGNHLNHASRQR